jgi:hypothetical protein
LLNPEEWNIFKSNAKEYDETVYPVDHARSGQIRDFSLFNNFVKPMPAGVTVTCVMDCCVSLVHLEICGCIACLLLSALEMTIPTCGICFILTHCSCVTIFYCVFLVSSSIGRFQNRKWECAYPISDTLPLKLLHRLVSGSRATFYVLSCLGQWCGAGITV